MSSYWDHLRTLSALELQSKLDAVYKRIDSNDGRLTTDSSAELDMALDEQEAIQAEIKRRMETVL